jgi:hypothetical protein
MRSTLAVLGLLLGVGGCASNPVRPSCGGWRLALANAGTFDMYGLACRHETTRALDIQHCVEQGGDPAACRAAVYAPREPTQITVEPRIIVFAR